MSDFVKNLRKETSENLAIEAGKREEILQSKPNADWARSELNAIRQEIRYREKAAAKRQ